MPEETIETATNSQYSGWVRSDKLISTPGAMTDFDWIEDDLMELSKDYQVIEVPYDPFQATQLATRMDKKGGFKDKMLEVRATVQNYSEPMKEIEGLVLDGRLHHANDPVLNWMVSNVVCHRDKKDNIYPNKERPENKIDGIVALIMCFNREIKHRPNESKYNQGAGLTVI